MGIHGLTKLIQKHAASAAKEVTLKQLSGYKVAIDGNLCLYQFLSAVRLGGGGGALVNRNGDVTSHLHGIFYKTIGLMAKGIKPIYVFDGKPPEIKVAELRRRRDVRHDANKKMKEGIAQGTSPEELDRFAVKSTWLSYEQVYDAKRLLYYMGIPMVQAPSEAEAQCAAMAKYGTVYATGSEDMDSLAFGSPVIVRHLAFHQDISPLQITLDDVLSSLDLTNEQFLDFCILLGCDYCEPIKGIGPSRALDMIKKFGTIEKILENLDASKYTIPKNWPNLDTVRDGFKNPKVVNPKFLSYICWDVPMEEEIMTLLVGKNQFNEDRVRKHIRMLRQARRDFPEPNQSEERQEMDPPPAPPEVDRNLELENQIKGFIDSPAAEFVFPSTLTSYERRLVHILAARNSLIHESFGEAGQRQIKIKRTEKTRAADPELEEDTYLS
eukprot:Phypoly_transcript_09545.p1 GENE.Phypoly_transcript_09545~~Phypoly_transcript_09545.p1  ORF type:complete len:439 (+),score=62.19 Phypoly_transcript_09545:48-1364(+)